MENNKIPKLKEINSINAHIDIINTISIFPSGNIISVSHDFSIKIWDPHLNIIQIILKAHNDNIIYVCIINENNFVTCSWKVIKTWNKKNSFENIFTLNNEINNAHNDWINKIIYSSKENLISCSQDKTIKIWEKNNKNNFQSITTLTHSDWVYSILLIEDKNILITSGIDGTKFWNLNNFENYNFQNVQCWNNNGLKRIDIDRIIVSGEGGLMKVISISKKMIIKEINNICICWGICIIKNKGIFLTGGESFDVRIFRYDNYECIQVIENAHKDYIYGFIQLNNDSIISYGWDNNMKIWSF